MSKRSCAAAESAESAVLRMARVNCIVCVPLVSYYISFWLLFYRVFCNFRVKKEVSHNFFHFTILLLLFFPVNFRNCSILCFQNYGFDYEIQQHNHTEYDTVPAEGFEIVLLDVLHQEFDGKNRYRKCHQHADDHDRHLNTGKGKAVFYQF